MFAALISFLGGSAFRMIWGELSHWMTAKQEHNHELERMRLEAEFAEAQHKRQMDSIKQQADMGIRVIEAQAVADVGRIEADAWLESVNATTKPIGVAWVDAWNAVIRPGGATWAIAMLTLDSFAITNVSDSAEQVCFAFLGLFVADRALGKKGK